MGVCCAPCTEGSRQLILCLVRPMLRVARLSARARHRMFCAGAILHSLLVIVLIRLLSSEVQWFPPVALWIAIATLWFFWPVVIVLHVGSSGLRTAVTLVLSAVIAGAWYPLYSSLAAPAFGLPIHCKLTPIRGTRFFSAYFRGRADARRDLRDTQLGLEISNIPHSDFAVEPLRERYGIAVRQVDVVADADGSWGHICGYNRVMAAEFARRFGVALLEYDTCAPNWEFAMAAHHSPE